MLKTQYRKREINKGERENYDIPTCIPCTRDDGIMILSLDGYYRCINVEGCNNKVKVDDYINQNKQILDL